MKITPPAPRPIALPTETKAEGKTTTPTPTPTPRTTPTPTTQHAPKTLEDAFEAMPAWKKGAVVAAGVAGLAVGGAIGEQLGMGIISNLLPNLSMVAYNAIPLATTLGAALVGTAAGVLPFFGDQEWQ